MERPLIKQLKYFCISFSFLLALFFAMNIYRVYTTVGKTEILNVQIRPLKTNINTYKEINIGENHFTTGTEGRLYWKVKNLKEAFLVNLSNINGSSSLIDLFYFLILNGTIYVMLWGITDDTIFSDRLIDGAIIIVYVIFFIPFSILQKI